MTATLEELKRLDARYEADGIARTDVRRQFLRTNEAWMRETLQDQPRRD